MRQPGGVGGHGPERADQAGGLACEHGQHLALEAGVAKRHAPQVLKVERSVIGGKRRGWHPFNPLQMKRHVR